MNGQVEHPVECLTPELARLLTTAQRELDRHVGDHGRCIACGSVWPCARAELAAFTLEAM